MRLLEAGAVRVESSVRAKSARVLAGEEVAIELPPAGADARAPEPDVELRIPYRDEHLLVVDKPAGIVVHAGAGDAGVSLVEHLRRHRIAGGDERERPGIVHRLDRDTSGLLVVARSEAAYRGLRALVRRRGLERGYLALVRGRPRSWRGRIEAPIGRDRSNPTRQSLDTATPREAVTHFEVERLLAGNALLAVRLETGRTHQIRVHLAAIGLPVVGDRVYGVPDPELRRQFLHASRLAFPHPLTGEHIETTSALPAELQACLARLAA